MQVPEFADSGVQDGLEPDLPNTISVQNLVATWNTDGEFDLETLSSDLSNSDYDPTRYASLIYRPENVDLSILVPRTGKLIITGTASVSEIKQSIETFVQATNRLGICIDTTANPVRIANIVATGELGVEVNLQEALTKLGFEDTEYEPEQFPGLIWKSSPGVVLIFNSGKYVITGTTTILGVTQTNAKLLDVLGHTPNN